MSIENKVAIVAVGERDTDKAVSVKLATFLGKPDGCGGGARWYGR